MIYVKNNNELTLMREAGKRTATILQMVASKVAPGVTTKELDEYAAELAIQFEGKCAFNGYHGFSGNICSSINDEVVHGVPGKRVIRDGDIVSIDFGLIYDGYIGDTAVTVPNFGPPGRGPLLKKGMTFAIEPMINLGSSKTKVMRDGWTVATIDGNPSAHFEHTIAVGIKSAEILTIPNDEI